MSEEITIDSSSNREEKYRLLIPQIEALLKDESNIIANLANLSSALKYGLDFFWVGFYIVRDMELVLGPFQGPVACTRIAHSKGVCGKAWSEKRTIIVPDVDQFPGHIACSAQSKSEIVVPILRENRVIMVLDVDSIKKNDFDSTDEKYLQEICQLIPHFDIVE